MSGEPSRETPLVVFRAVEKTYDGVVNVVERLDLEIQRGEFLTLLGPSGSGKTTTLMMLAGFEAPTAGEILLNGRSLARIPPFRRNIGMVFQNYALFPHMTIGDNVAYPLRRRRFPRPDVEARVRRALEMVRLGGLEQRFPGQLSGGQQQRVALARALVFEPDVVLMDEPLGALDKKLREDMQLEIRHLHQALGMTVIYVTHDQAEALTMSDRIAVFSDGRIQQVGSPREVYERPFNAFVANFIGENNMLPGVIVTASEPATSMEGAPRLCTVQLDEGSRVEARAHGRHRAGERVAVSIRPERLELARRPDGRNSVEGRLLEVIYFGDHARLRVLVGQTEVMVKAPLDEWRLSGCQGERVDLSWSTDHGLVLAPATDAGTAA